jgi:hypothetical protein
MTNDIKKERYLPSRILVLIILSLATLLPKYFEYFYIELAGNIYP